MNIATFTEVLLPVLEAKITPLVWGQHAKGKTEVIEHFYKSRDWLIFNFRLNIMADVGDFLGLADFALDENGNKTATKFHMPNWLNECIKFCKANPDKRACVFLDEINRPARFDLLGPVFQVSLDRKLHEVVFPDNLDVIAAANPATKDYKVLSIKDEALLSRFWHVYFSPTVKEWHQHSVKKEYDPNISLFLEESPQFLEQDDLATFSVSDYAKPDRRKWSKVNELLKQGKLTKDQQIEVFGGLIGVTATIAFEAFLKKQDKPVTAEEILKNYALVRPRILAAKNSEQTRTDVLGQAASKIIEHFNADTEFSEEEGTNAISFIKDLPNDQMFSVMHAIYRKRKFHDFCESHYEALKMIELEDRLRVIRRTVQPETLKENG